MSQFLCSLANPFLVVVYDGGEFLAVGGYIGPEGMAGHGGKIKLLPRQRQRPLQAAVPVADAAVVVNVSPEELILHHMSFVRIVECAQDSTLLT